MPVLARIKLNRFIKPLLSVIIYTKKPEQETNILNKYDT